MHGISRGTEGPESGTLCRECPVAYVPLPATPTAPMSWSSHGTGSGCEVTIKMMGLLSSMFGATETTNGPEVAPDGIVMMMDVLVQKPTVTGALFSVTKLAP